MNEYTSFFNPGTETSGLRMNKPKQARYTWMNITRSLIHEPKQARGYT